MATVTGTLTVKCADEAEADAAEAYFSAMAPEENEVVGVKRSGLELTVPLRYPDWNPATAMDHQEDLPAEEA